MIHCPVAMLAPFPKRRLQLVCFERDPKYSGVSLLAALGFDSLGSGLFDGSRHPLRRSCRDEKLSFATAY